MIKGQWMSLCMHKEILTPILSLICTCKNIVATPRISITDHKLLLLHTYNHGSHPYNRWWENWLCMNRRIIHLHQNKFWNNWWKAATNCHFSHLRSYQGIPSIKIKIYLKTTPLRLLIAIANDGCKMFPILYDICGNYQKSRCDWVQLSRK